MPKLKLPQSQRARLGFTLIELMVTITIIAIIAAIGLVLYSNSQIYARDNRRKQDLKSIQAALELYRQTNSRYPTTGAWIYDSAGNPCTPTASWVTDSSNPSIPLDDASHKYINQTPTDPKTNCKAFMTTNGSGQYGYAYRTGKAADGSACTNDTNNNQNYILVTVLENANDSDVNSKKNYKDCGGTGSAITATDTTNISPNLYVLTNP